MRKRFFCAVGFCERKKCSYGSKGLIYSKASVIIVSKLKFRDYYKQRHLKNGGKTMKIKILGTAAAEGVPGLFCTCERCERARRLGGKEIRTRSQTLVDGKLLIDFSADTYLHVLRDGLPLHEIKHCLISHPHMDHLYSEDFAMRGKGFATLNEEDAFHVYGAIDTLEICRSKRESRNVLAQGRVKLHEVSLFSPFEVMNYTVTPLEADHDVGGAVIYLISDGEKTMLYGHDTGYFTEATWEYLEKTGVKLDFVSLDCCYALKECRREHMGIDACREVADRLTQIGAVDKNSVLCLNHFSHNVILSYEEMLTAAQEKGFILSYDGIEIEV